MISVNKTSGHAPGNICRHRAVRGDEKGVEKIPAAHLARVVCVRLPRLRENVPSVAVHG